MDKNRAVLYLRLSKEDQDKINVGDESVSIINQRMLLTDFALEKGFQITEVYQDDDYSGLFADRPDFERLIEDAKLQKFDIIIAKSQSRFTRNMEHMEKYLHNVFPLLGIRFIGVVDSADTSNKGNKKSRQINGLVNEWYSEDLSESIRAIFQSKMKDGQFLGSSTPYGYVKNPNNHNHLIVDEYAASVIKKIFKLYISGNGKAKIGAILSQEGILIPSEYKVKVLKQNYHNANALKTTKLWSYQTIHQILNNEVYIGHTVQNKCKTLTYKSKTKKAIPKEEWIKVENTHEPIIDLETWNLTQEIGRLKTRTVNADNKVGLFSGKLFCNECKHSMARNYNKKSEFTGYYCKTYKKHGNKFCTSHSISDDLLQEIVLSTIKSEAKKILSIDNINKLSTFQIINKNTTDINKNISHLESEILAIDKYKKKIYEDYVDGVFTKNEFIEYKEKYRIQEEQLNIKIEGMKLQILDEEKIHKQYDEWENNFKNYINIKNLDRNVIVELIESINIYEDITVDIEFKFCNPYE